MNTEHMYWPAKIPGSIKIIGGKHYLARHHLAMAPLDCCEMFDPYCGSGVVTLNAPKRFTQRYMSDTNWLNINVLRAIRYAPEELVQCLNATEYSEARFQEAKYHYLHSWKKGTGDEPYGYEEWDVNIAAGYLAVCRMSRGGLRETFAWSDRQRGGQPGDLNAWLNFIKNVPLISSRLQDVEIFTQNALTGIKNCRSFNNTWIYCDPPYLKETRTAKKAYGPHEVDKAHHERLLEIITNVDFAPKVMLCGYPNPLYDKVLGDWWTWQKEMPNHSGQGKEKQPRTEKIWCNYVPSNQIAQTKATTRKTEAATP